MDIFKDKNFVLYRRGVDTYGLIVYNHRLANKINKTLGGYYDTKICDKEEPVFVVTSKELDYLLSVFPKGYDRGYIREKIASFSTDKDVRDV